jgi:Zn-dependent alcohol dehydrogenase
MHAARAIVAYAPTGGPNMKMEDITVEAVKEDELMVELIATGVCHTDIFFAMLPEQLFPYPKVFGHEGECIKELK